MAIKKKSIFPTPMQKSAGAKILKHFATATEARQMV